MHFAIRRPIKVPFQGKIRVKLHFTLKNKTFYKEKIVDSFTIPLLIFLPPIQFLISTIQSGAFMMLKRMINKI
jgi:hypothetical protein